MHTVVTHRRLLDYTATVGGLR